jgi:AraC-like DNA-binding protein
VADEGGQQATWLKLREAAGRLGVSERTLRRRIRDGSAQGRQVSTPFGAAWEILVGGAGHAAGLPTTPGGRANGHTDPALIEALRLLDQRDQTIMELAGRVGYLQAELSQAREQLALVAPSVPPATQASS